MVCYYAHCVALYNTKQEERDLITLKALGFEVLNPNQEEIQIRCAAAKDKGEDVMALFEPLVLSCDVFAFRALPDGVIPSGVYKELLWAEAGGKLIIELPSATERRALSLEATRQYLREGGWR